MFSSALSTDFPLACPSGYVITEGGPPAYVSTRSVAKGRYVSHYMEKPNI